MSRFQIILLVTFGFFILVAVLSFALYKGGSGAGTAKVVVWGDISNQDFSYLLSTNSISQDKNLIISYVEKPDQTIEEDFTEALASGNGPDLIIFTQDKFWKNKNKLIPIPYSSIGEKDFRDTFVEGSEVYLTQEGIYGLPLLVDPLVLYYNRDLLSAAGLAKPLSYWDEIYKQTSQLTQKDQAGNIVRSAVALGETRNINNSKDIISLLLLQAGSSITGFSGPYLRATLGDNEQGLIVRPAEAALDFYTQFSNPTKSFYSWNRTLPEAQTRFTSGDLAYYIGYSSELHALRNKNPTLNFAVAPVPQSRVAGKNTTMTTGKIYAVSISRGTKNMSGAFTAALKLTNAESITSLVQTTLMPPARRDLLGQKPTDAVLPVFWNAALQTKSWLDPDRVTTGEILTDMVDTVTSGRVRVSQAVNRANEQLQSLIDK
jgi:ABC-type glycerol-3-phosphate transport system substrate-binding protein